MIVYIVFLLSQGHGVLTNFCGVMNGTSEAEAQTKRPTFTKHREVMTGARENGISPSDGCLENGSPSQLVSNDGVSAATNGESAGNPSGEDMISKACEAVMMSRSDNEEEKVTESPKLDYSDSMAIPDLTDLYDDSSFVEEFKRNCHGDGDNSMRSESSHGRLDSPIAPDLDSNDMQSGDSSINQLMEVDTEQNDSKISASSSLQLDDQKVDMTNNITEKQSDQGNHSDSANEGVMIIDSDDDDNEDDEDRDSDESSSSSEDSDGSESDDDSSSDEGSADESTKSNKGEGEEKAHSDKIKKKRELEDHDGDGDDEATSDRDLKSLMMQDPELKETVKEQETLPKEELAESSNDQVEVNVPVDKKEDDLPAATQIPDQKEMDINTAIKDNEKSTLQKKENVPEKVLVSKKLSRLGRLLPPEQMVPDTLRPMSSVLMDAGQSVVVHQIYQDLLLVQNRRKEQGRLDSEGLEELHQLVKLSEDAAKLAHPFALKRHRCEKCNFKATAENALQTHLEYAHWENEENGTCALCDLPVDDPHKFMRHMDKVHHRKGRLRTRLSKYCCPFCPFETNTKTPLGRHVMRCERAFRPDKHCEPTPADCDIPLKKSKVTVTTGKSLLPSAKVGSGTLPMSASGKVNIAGATSLLNVRPRMVAPTATAPSIRSPSLQGVTLSPALTAAANVRPQYVQIGGSLYCLMMQNGKQVLLPLMNQGKGPGAKATPPTVASMVSQFAKQGKSPISANTKGLSERSVTEMTAAAITAAALRAVAPNRNIPIAPSARAIRPSPVRQPISATHNSQRASYTGKMQLPPILKKNTVANLISNQRTQNLALKGIQKDGEPVVDQTFEVCEVCGGFVKDKEALRIHFFWAHKVDIPKEIFHKKNPGVTCDMCPNSFWTYQGLARHQRAKHSNKGAGSTPPKSALNVSRSTPNLAKNSNQTLTSCVICNANPNNLLGHLKGVHNMTIDNMCQMKTCLVCGKTMLSEIEVESHIATAHSLIYNQFIFGDSASTTTSKSPQPSARQAINTSKRSTIANLLKPDGKKQVVPTGIFQNNASPGDSRHRCVHCGLRCPTANVLINHQRRAHNIGVKVKHFHCIPCGLEFTSEDHYNSHCQIKHTIVCTRCSERFTSKDLQMKHLREKHHGEKDVCALCDEKIPYGQPFIRHVKRLHIKKCSCIVVRMKKSEVKEHLENYTEYMDQKLRDGVPLGLPPYPTESKRRKYTPSKKPGPRNPAAKIRSFSLSHTSPSKPVVTDEVIEIKDTPKKAGTENATVSRLEIDGEEILVQLQED